MKKNKFLLLIASVLLMSSLSGCSSTPTYTVTWKNYDGTVLEQDVDAEEGSIPSYDGTTPIREGDAQYTYTFSGWSPSTETKVNSDMTFIAQYSSSINEYTITWQNDDGTILDTETYKFGETPTYKGVTPSKSSDDQYTYSFSGWSPTISPVSSNTTYVARYGSTINEYTIKWIVDGVTEEETYQYRQMPIYKNGTPVKTADEQYTYAFTGWSPTVTQVVGNATYVAQFSNTINQYQITWKNHDGSLLLNETYNYGDTPEFKGDEPAREPNAQYTYIFNGWSPEITSVTGNATYFAQFKGELNEYKIKWDINGVITEEMYKHGETPTFKGGTPTKSSDAQYSYSFSGWSPAINAVVSDTTYVAQFNNSINTYTITWKDYNGATLLTETYNYGETPNFKEANPSRPTDAQYTYAFIGWIPSIVPVVGNQEYIATYSETLNTYTIVWKNDDGTFLTAESYKYGETPTYKADTPVKEGNTQYSFKFKGWTPSIVPVVGNQEYIATFEPVVNQYEVVWKNYDGTILDSEMYDFGDTPSYKGETPTKESEAPDFYDYSFSKWNNNPSPVYGNQEYIAQFEIDKQYIEVEKKDDLTYKITKYNLSDKDVMIPNNYCGQPISEIGDNAFENCTYIETVKIPNSISKIGYYAFQNCTSLISIEIPDNGLAIYGYAFNGCISLRSLIIPPSVSYGMGIIKGCTSIEEITINDCSSLAFQNLFGSNVEPSKSLKKVTINSGTTAINSRCFEGAKYVKEIIIPETVTSIGRSAFESCFSLYSLTIPSSVTYISQFAIQSCDITEIINKSSVEITSSSNGHVITSEADSKISLGDDENVYYIDGDDIRLLYYKEDSTNIIIPDYVTSIRTYALVGCTTAVSLTMPIVKDYSGEHQIEDYFGVYPESLKTITISKIYDDQVNVRLWECPVETIVFKDGLVLSFLNTYFRMFQNCKNLVSVIFPENSITDMAAAMFSGCAAIQTVTFPDSTNYIGGSCFENCTSLTHLIVPNKVAEINRYAFRNCPSLQYLVLPLSLTSISESSFTLCSSLESIYYMGTEEQWNLISGINQFDAVVKFFYCEEEPSEAGNYWHYIDGVPTIWGE